MLQINLGVNKEGFQFSNISAGEDDQFNTLVEIFHVQFTRKGRELKIHIIRENQLDSFYLF